MPDARVLVVDDNAHELGICVEALAGVPGVRVQGVQRSNEALARLGAEAFDLLVTDLRMPMVDGLDLLRVAVAQDPHMPVLMLTGFPSVDTALASLKEGASDYLTKPVHPDELTAVVQRLLEGRKLRREHRLLERRLNVSGEASEMIGASPLMVSVFDLIRKLAASDLDVLVIGETGTGKELAARRIHRLSGDGAGRFVPVDCAAIPEALAESELFGHEKGAFTGADRRAMGLLEYADGGTFFLDEVQALPLTVQAKLLRALQERTFRRVGATEERTVRVRVIAAANERPEDLVQAGRLREDLYHRLNVGRVDLPPLIARAGDIELLVEHLLERSGSGAVRAVSEEALAALRGYAWPGNVRELQNVLRRALALSSHEVLRPDDLPAPVRGEDGSTLHTGGPFEDARERALASFERAYLTDALRRNTGDVTAAARSSGMSRATMYRLLKKHGVDPNLFRSFPNVSQD